MYFINMFLRGQHCGTVDKLLHAMPIVAMCTRHVPADPFLVQLHANRKATKDDPNVFELCKSTWETLEELPVPVFGLD